MEVIPLFKPSYTQKEIDAVAKVMRSGWIGLGPVTAEFEKKFAEFVGVKYAVAVSSATAALDLAIKAHDIHDAEVIVPALTFVSTGLAPLYNNNKVVFADIDENTLCIDWEDVKRKITPKTKAIIPVWYGGKTTPIPKLRDDIVIIEDAAHASGNHDAGKHNTTCWSFHAVKNLATADGGMITTNDETIYRKLLPLRWVGIDRSTWERAQSKYGWAYDIQTVGYKAHMNDLNASIGLVQLERLGNMNNLRKMRVLQYLQELKHLSWLRLPEWDKQSAWHLFVVRIDEKERNTFLDYMLAKGISVGVHYKPIHLYPIFKHQDLPVTDRVWKEIVTLPLFPDMTDDAFDHIIKAIQQYK